MIIKLTKPFLKTLIKKATLSSILLKLQNIAFAQSNGPLTKHCSPLTPTTTILSLGRSTKTAVLNPS